MILVALAVGLIIVSGGTAARGFRRFGLGINRKRGLGNWLSVVGALYGGWMLVTAASDSTPGAVVFGAVIGVAIGLLVLPAASRWDSRE
jgi:hypothetical protein